MNPLQGTYDAYLVQAAALSAADVSAAASSTSAFHESHLDGMTADDIRDALTRGRSELNDLAIVALYAAFEAAIRAHVEAQVAGLTPPAALPAGIGSSLIAAASEWSQRLKMKTVRGMYHSTVGPQLASDAGHIEKYRNWVAHGRGGPSPPYFDPDDTFEVLTRFLKSARIL